MQQKYTTFRLTKKSLEHTGIVCIFLFEFVVPEVQYTSDRKAEKHGDLP